MATDQELFTDIDAALAKIAKHGLESYSTPDGHSFNLADPEKLLRVRDKLAARTPPVGASKTVHAEVLDL